MPNDATATNRLLTISADLQARDQSQNWAGPAPYALPGSVTDFTERLRREAEAAIAAHESEVARVERIIGDARSLQARLDSARRLFKEKSDALDGLKESLAVDAETLGRIGWSNPFPGWNPHWVRGLAETSALVAFRAHILKGARAALDEVEEEMAKFIAANKAKLQQLGLLRADDTLGENRHAD